MKHNRSIRYFYISLFGILFIFLASPEARQARCARCVGTFTIGKHAAPASMDIYSSRLSPERTDPQAVVKVRLKVSLPFDVQTVIDNGGRILRQQGQELLISCRSGSIERIAALPGVEHCSISRRAQPLMDSVRSQCRINEVHGTSPGPRILPASYTGKGVLAGILDSEFDTRHPAFLDSSGKTRFIAIWDQEDTVGAHLNRYGYGTIKNRSELLVDTLFGLANSSHGTHTASTMAGSDKSHGYYGAAPDAMIAAVRYTGETEIADGLKWICSLADSLKVPCVINMSIGIASGPHDGTSLVDRIIDSISGPGKIIVGAVGNDGAKNAHIRYSLGPGASGNTWALPSINPLSGGGTESYFGADFWGESGKYFSGGFLLMDRRTLKYLQSGNTFSTSKSRLYNEDTLLWNDSLSGQIDTFFLQYGVERSNDNNHKTHMVVRARTKNPSLLLGITVTNPAASGSTAVHGWNMMKEVFDAFGIPGFVNGDSLYTVNEIGGTANSNITVGAYTARTIIPLWNGTPFYHANCVAGDIFLSSSVGPTVDGRTKPDLTAPGWSVIAALSRNGARNHDEVAVWPDTANTLSRYGGMTGTSMAAPVVAGIVALMLQADPTLTPDKVRTLLCETAIKDGFTGPLSERSNKWGAGKVNAFAALAQLSGISVAHDRKPPEKDKPHIRISRSAIVFSPAHYPYAGIELLDMHGRKVFRRQAAHTARIAIHPSLPAGVYTARILYAGRVTPAVATLVIIP